MKKIIFTLLISLVLLFSLQANANSELMPLDAQVYLNGEMIDFSVPLLTYDGRTLVPMRELFEKLGASVEWIENEQKIISTTDTKTIEMRIDDFWSVCNDINFFTEAPPILYNDKTLVPLRFVGEQMNLDVIWNDETKTITMNSRGIVTLGSVSGTFWDEANKCEIYKEYTGELVDGVPTGVGKMKHHILQSENTISSEREGCFLNWQQNGWSWTISPSGTTTFGRYDNGTPTGGFAIRFTNGSTWYGEVFAIGEKGCIPHGKGVFIYSDGSEYHCNMVFSVMEGYGELYSPQGILLYAGDHKNGVSNGYGKLYDDSGYLAYEGQFENGYCHGYGIEYGENGFVVYEGEFKNGYYNGYGKLYDENGYLIYAGIFPIEKSNY